MYRWFARAASSLIALEMLAGVALASPAYADTAAQDSASPAVTPPYGLLDIYPRNGTSYSQQARDQYECDIAAVKQTGFNPMLPNGGVPLDVTMARQAEYMRAEAACLEARGYRVKIVNARP